MTITVGTRRDGSGRGPTHKSNLSLPIWFSIPPFLLRFPPWTYLRARKKKLKKPLLEFSSRFVEFSAGLPLTSIDDSAQDYSVQSTGRDSIAIYSIEHVSFFNNKIRDLVIKKANDVSIYKNLSFFFSFSFFLSFSFCLLSLFLFIYISIYLSIFFLSFCLSFSPSLSIREVIHDYSYIMIWQSEMSVSLTQVRNKMYRCWNYKFINSIRSQALKRLYSLRTSRAADPQGMFHASPPHF